ncbi:hypothetical protein QVD17_19586 [Tagetes erecta]|uniref:Uncharacterized protein n=1 Tax=Tagetes erecta TaxID=13708 RepID=A0AAD8NX18_TARER|nr:hypothetical protein QVD17_19586 [Tagetes erecta]
MCALLYENHEKATRYKDCIRWLKSSHIHYAISHSPTIYELHVRDIWRTAVLNVSRQPSRICSKVNGHDIEFTEADLARILRLEGDVGDEVKMTAEEVYGALRTAGYEGSMPGEKKMEFVKSYLIKEWRYIAHVFIMCLDHRKGGTDGLNLDWARAMVLFYRGQKANLAKLIFNYMLENIHAANRDKWLLYHRFVQIILNDKRPDLPVLGDTLKIWSMHLRIFGDCKSVRSDCVGRISYLWENMYLAGRWVHIQRLTEIERKRGSKNVEVVEKKLTKRKQYAKDKEYSLDREIDKVQAEIDAGREKRTKRKSDAPAETEKKTKHDVPVATAESVTGLKSELVDLKGKYAELEIFKVLNSLKEKDGSDPAMTEQELNSLTDAAKYPLMQSEFGAETEKKAVSSENVEEIDDDLEDEPEKYNVEDKDVTYLFEHIDLDKSEWFKKDVAVIPEVPIFQHLDELNTSKLDRQVIAWKYNSQVDAYMIKWRGGDISYIKNRKHFATLPRWDLRRLAELPLLGKEDSGRACAFEVTIRKVAENNFNDFGVRVPDTQPPRLQDFLKWFYDNSTGEAIIRLEGEDRPEIRLFDPMEIFSFCDEDIKCYVRMTLSTGQEMIRELKPTCS